MPNENGSLYGLTILSPILNDERATPSHDLQIREYLATWPTDEDSPFAIAGLTHLARLVVMDDVIYVGMPACEEHLKHKYLILEANLDGELEPYLAQLAKTAPAQIDAIWSHCVGYPGVSDSIAFVRYMRACQIETTFYFAAVNDKSVTETLTALQTQRAVADFITTHQGMRPAQLQREFLAFAAKLRSTPAPKAASAKPHRSLKMGGRNE